jgi:sodium pump decarboxylase gamma subunit
MLEFGLYVTAVGMGGVFLVLSILALFMVITGKLFEEKKEIRPEEFTKEEIIAITAAINAYESVKVPYIETSYAWKNYARIESVRWFN